jgi:ribosomal protein S18 acetylase RimI-like enzyme
MSNIIFKPANLTDLNPFFLYLDRHLRENGQGQTAKFQPLELLDSKMNDAISSKFSDGLTIAIGKANWRRLILAFDGEKIVGHIDVRGHLDKYSSHRALLGMGVDSQYRGRGIGSQLIVSLIEWVEQNTAIEFIDLSVLDSNTAAYQLYKKHGFIQVGKLDDRFRLDGHSYSDRMMSLFLERQN